MRWDKEHDQYELKKVYKERKIYHIHLGSWYLLNIGPTKILEKIPMAIWQDETPFIKHQRIFGLTCFRHIPY